MREGYALFYVRGTLVEGAVLLESLNKKSPNFLKPQKTYIKGLPKVKNVYVEALKFLPKTWFKQVFFCTIFQK